MARRIRVLLWAQHGRGAQHGRETQPAKNDPVGFCLRLRDGPKSLQRSSWFEKRVRCRAGGIRGFLTTSPPSDMRRMISEKLPIPDSCILH